jgi:hypothetical protein
MDVEDAEAAKDHAIVNLDSAVARTATGINEEFTKLREAAHGFANLNFD